MNETKNKQGWIKENLKAVLWAALIAIVIRSFIGAPFNIPSGSMLPSLQIGDYLFASKYSYGYSKYSLPFGIIPFPGRIFSHEPKRGDVVIFRQPQDPALNPIVRALTSNDYIKRLIGLPGDTVQVQKGRLYINGTMVPRNFKRTESGVNPFGQNISFKVYDETLPNGVVHEIMEHSDEEAKDNTPEYKIPEGHYFFMGDNRDNSQDSRFEQVGMVPRENLIGKAQFIFYSNNGYAPFWAFWYWGQSLRFDRFFDRISP